MPYPTKLILRNNSEIDRATELLADETFRHFVSEGINAHYILLNQLGAEPGAESMTPNIDAEIASLRLLRELVHEDLLVYKVTQTRLGVVFIDAAPSNVVEGDRILLEDEHNQTANQVSIKISFPKSNVDSGDFLTRSAEKSALLKYKPDVTLSIVPETLSLGNRGVEFRGGCGLTMDFYDPGYVEVFGSMSAGRHEYVSRQALLAEETGAVTELLDKLLRQ